MKKVKISTEKCLAVYNILGNCKYGKLEDADKIRLWRIVRQLQPVAEGFAADRADAARRLRPEGMDETEQRMAALERERMAAFGDISTPQREQAFVRQLMADSPEYADYRRELARMQQTVGEAVSQMAARTVELAFEPLTEEAFARLMGGNEWTMAQAVAAGEVITGG